MGKGELVALLYLSCLPDGLGLLVFCGSSSGFLGVDIKCMIVVLPFLF